MTPRIVQERSAMGATPRSNASRAWNELDVPILMYHHVVPGSVVPPELDWTIALDLFERQLDILARRGFQTIGFTDLCRVAAGEMARPAERIVSLTFDDGFQSFSTLAVPALARRGMRATVFVVAGEIGGHNRWDADRGRPRLELMGDAHIRSALAAGMEIGVHSWSHVEMTGCGPEELEREIVQAKREIDARFGIVTEAFAYPYGGYTPAHFPILARAGFRGAASISSTGARVTSQPYAMRRVVVGQNDRPARFNLKMSRLFLRYRAIVDRRRG